MNRHIEFGFRIALDAVSLRFRSDVDDLKSRFWIGYFGWAFHVVSVISGQGWQSAPSSGRRRPFAR
jgi:hypothetical protein